MKDRLNINFRHFFSFGFISIFLFACSSYFENPLKDKETGEDINLLILDFNFFNTRMTYKLMDAEDSTTLNLPATITFTGQNGNDIVTYTGKKESAFYTDKGQLELTVDPNVTITESSPLEFAVNVEVEGYNKLSKGIKFNQEGKKTIELYLSKKVESEPTDLEGNIDIENGDTTIIFSYAKIGLKSGLEEEKPFKVQHGISLNDFLKLKDESGNLIFTSLQEVLDAYNANPQTFAIMSFTPKNYFSPGIDLMDINGNAESVLIQFVETDSLEQITIVGKKVGSLNGAKITSTCEYTGIPKPDIFGFADFVVDRWKVSGTEIITGSLNLIYNVVGAHTSICETGASITFTSTVTSSFSIDADVYDENDNFLFPVTFKGNFPETFVLENVPQGKAKIVFRDNLATFEAIDQLVIDDVCENIEKVVNVTPVNGYEEYQIVIKAICPDNLQVAIAPTYNAYFKLKDSDDPWQGIDLIEGVVDLLGLPGREYDLRLYWQNDWEYATYWTDFDADGNYLHSTDDKTKIRSEIMEDGRIRIIVDQIFKQSVCDDMGW